MFRLVVSAMGLMLIVAALVVAASRVGGGTFPGNHPDFTASWHDAELDQSKATTQPMSSTWLTPQPVQRPSRKATDSPGDPAGTGLIATYLSTNHKPEGDMPRDVVFTADGTAAVIVNRDTDNMTFFDVATRTITHTVPVGDFPVDVAVTPDGLFAVAANVFSNSVSVIDIASHTVVAHVPITGEQPYRVKTTSDSQFVVVGVINDATNSSFSVIDLDLLEETLSFASAPQGVFGWFFTPESGTFGNIYTQFALSPDDSTIVLPDRGSGRVVLYECATGDELVSLPTAAAPTAVDVSADGTLAVVSHEGSHRRITVIDLISHTVASELPTPSELFWQIIRITPDKTHAIAAALNHVIFLPLTAGTTTAMLYVGAVFDIELSFDGQYAFVPNLNARVIDIATQTIVKTLPFAACADEAATSPVEHRAVALNNRFREDICLYNINGSAGFAEGKAASGVPPEGDATRTVAVTPDCQTAVAVNNTSDNVTVIDLPSRTVTAYVPTGERSLGVAVTPDNTYAVVANASANTVSIIDLGTNAKVADLSVPTGPAEVRISPDGELVYVASTESTDRIHFIELDGAASSVVGSLIVGDMGFIDSYVFSLFSGIELSPDGSILAVCESLDDTLRLIDTTTRQTLAIVPVGDFPIRVAFSPDGSRAYVSHSFSDDVYSIDVAGGTTDAVIPGIEFPLTVTVDGTGAFLYVGSCDFQNPAIKVIDTAAETVVATVPLTGRPLAADLSAAGEILYVATSASELVRIRAGGADSVILGATPLTSIPSDMAVCDATLTVVIAQPFPDGVDIIGPLVVFADGFESGDTSAWSSTVQ